MVYGGMAPGCHIDQKALGSLAPPLAWHDFNDFSLPFTTTSAPGRSSPSSASTSSISRSTGLKEPPLKSRERENHSHSPLGIRIIQYRRNDNKDVLARLPKGDGATAVSEQEKAV